MYLVAQVEAELARQPERWLGRPMRVRGTVLRSGYRPLDAGGGTPCRNRPAHLIDHDGASLLPVAGWQPDPLLTALRRLPLAGGLVPAPQQIRWRALATYRVRQRAAPALACGTPPRYEALLLDAELGSL